MRLVSAALPELGYAQLISQPLMTVCQRVKNNTVNGFSFHEIHNRTSYQSNVDQNTPVSTSYFFWFF